MSKKLSPRALKALEILKEGGYFREQLESQYRGGEKFVVRLRNAAGKVAKGFGFASREELEKAGMLIWRECERSSVWPSERVLNVPAFELSARLAKEGW